MAASKTEEMPAMTVQPQKEHQWLRKFAGEWGFQGEAAMGPGKPPVTWEGTVSVRSIAGVWVVQEWEGEEPDGSRGISITTLGFDPQKRRFVGTFIGTMVTHLWVYEGTLDAAERVLTLEAEGAGMMDEAKMAKYRDVYELESDDHRTLTSYVLGDDGDWQQMMRAHYRRR